MNELAVAVYHYEVEREENALSLVSSEHKSLFQTVKSILDLPARMVAFIIDEDDLFQDWI